MIKTTFLMTKTSILQKSTGKPHKMQPFGLCGVPKFKIMRRMIDTVSGMCYNRIIRIDTMSK